MSLQKTNDNTKWRTKKKRKRKYHCSNLAIHFSWNISRFLSFLFTILRYFGYIYYFLLFFFFHLVYLRIFLIFILFSIDFFSFRSTATRSQMANKRYACRWYVRAQFWWCHRKSTAVAISATKRFEFSVHVPSREHTFSWTTRE